MPLLTPVLPGARSLNRSASDLVWLMTQADGRRLSGQYVDGRVADLAKIARTVEVGHSLLATIFPPGAVG